MAPTEAQKRASAKYQKENIASLACRVRKEEAEAFKAYCANIGKTSNAVLREYVLDCIGEKGESEIFGPSEATSIEGIILAPETLKTAQEAAQRAGEPVSAFVGRAVETQAQRDKLLQSMKKAPAKTDA